MAVRFRIGNFWVGQKEPLFFILGPCVIETEEITLKIAEKIKELSEKLKINVIFKASYDKANRT
ncbi:MAG: 3-deoxy-8-phosphooctulonate synthase, partial [Thermosulfidibacteraceae bacterium]